MTTRSKHEGTLTKRKDGKWQGQIKIDNKRHSVYGKTRSEVQEKIKELVKRHEAGASIKPINYTIEEWSNLWLHDYLKLKVRGNSFLQQESIVRKHIVPEVGNIPLQKLSVLHIQKLVRKKLDSGLSPVMVQKIRNTMYAIIQYAVDTGLLMKNFVKIVAVKVAKSKEMKSLSLQEVQKLMVTARDHLLYPALLLLITTGIRRSELCGIKWSDINWQQGTIYIQRAVVKLGTYDILINDTKTSSSRRLLPVPPMVLEALRQHQQVSPTMEYVFSRPDGQPIYPEVIYDFIKRLGKKIGVPSVSVHMLRHTVASLLLEAGENPKVVQELLGHSSIGITMDIYSHVIAGMKEQAIGKLTGMLTQSAVQSAV